MQKKKPHTVSVDICDIIWEATLKGYVTWFSYKRKKAYRHITFQLLLSHLHQKKHKITVFLLWCALQASEGVPIRFFTMLPELVDAYYSPNMGLVTHLQYSVQREEEVEEEPGQKPSHYMYYGFSIKFLPVIDVKDPKHAMCLCAAEPSLPPQLPPRNFTPNDVKENDSSEQPCKSLSDTYLARLHYMDLST